MNTYVNLRVIYVRSVRIQAIQIRQIARWINNSLTANTITHFIESHRQHLSASFGKSLRLASNTIMKSWVYVHVYKLLLTDTSVKLPVLEAAPGWFGSIVFVCRLPFFISMTSSGTGMYLSFCCCCLYFKLWSPVSGIASHSAWETLAAYIPTSNLSIVHYYMSRNYHNTYLIRLSHRQTDLRFGVFSLAPSSSSLSPFLPCSRENGKKPSIISLVTAHSIFTIMVMRFTFSVSFADPCNRPQLDIFGPPQHHQLHNCASNQPVMKLLTSNSSKIF